MKKVLRHDLDARRLLVGLMLIVVAVVSITGPIERALFWDEGTLTIQTCRSYTPLTLQRRPANVSDIGGTLEHEDKTQHVFHGVGLRVHACPPPGTVLDVVYDPADSQQAQPPDHPMIFLASLAMVVVGFGIIFWPGRRKEAPAEPH